jgi:hypothetical protein
MQIMCTCTTVLLCAKEKPEPLTIASGTAAIEKTIVAYTSDATTSAAAQRG